eukprot:gene15317-biopygen24356
MTSTSTVHYCVYCNVDIDPNVDYVSELSCTYNGCGRLTYHKDQAYPGQFQGSNAPEENGKGVLPHEEPCVGRIKEHSRYLPRNQKKKMMKKMKVDAPTFPYAQPIPISVSKNVIEAYSPPKVTEVSIMDFISIKPQMTMSKRGFSKQLYVCPVVEQQKPVHEEFPPLPTYHASRSLTPTEPPMALCATEDEEMCAIDVHELILLCCPDLMMCS